MIRAAPETMRAAVTAFFAVFSLRTALLFIPRNRPASIKGISMAAAVSSMNGLFPRWDVFYPSLSPYGWKAAAMWSLRRITA